MITLTVQLLAEDNVSLRKRDFATSNEKNPSEINFHQILKMIQQKQYEMKKKYVNVIKKWKKDEEEKKCHSTYNCMTT
ncbi:hypothetical protein T4B_10950 [Trichinella pseudospiralis]|uniref:Uncharacterized protein n=1 Tax=Trichinella pseudospiralis TaxID=6337 RepID=A0A0V1JRG7_TRIPS|nr:hypothetical protein T4B_10950 [Trichinella pseudospiralis]KRZ37567.1 hypothetical protein T4C_5249 [Trichinella pseudospiralis]